MKAKGIVALITVMTLVFSLFISVNAYDERGLSEDKIRLMIAAGEIPPVNMVDESNVSIKRDKAVELAKVILDKLESYQLIYASLSNRWDTGGYVWNLEFRVNMAPGGSATVNVDADTGEILYFNCWEGYDGTQNFVAKITREEAKVLAEKFLADVIKYDISTLELQREHPYAYYYKTGGTKEPVIYNFSYYKKFNDIPFYNSNIGIGIDGTTGKVKSYHTSMDKVDPSLFPAVDEIISPEDAVKEYKDNALIALQYVTIYNERPYGPPEEKTIQAYVPVININMIDAQTGKFLNLYNDTYLQNIEAIRKLYLEPSPLNPNAALTGRRTNEAYAERIANNIKRKVEKLLDVTFDATPEATYDMPAYYSIEQDIWHYNWSRYNEDGKMAHLSVSISGKTGHILNIGISSWDTLYDEKYGQEAEPPEVQENITWEEGKEKALSIIKTLLPDQYGFFADHTVIKPDYSAGANKYSREHHYTYSRVANGLVYRDNYISLSVDRETGDLRNFSFNWSDVEFPSVSDVITGQQALDIFAEGLEAKLVYYLHTDYDVITGRPVYSESPVLAYNLTMNGLISSSMMIDAKTGKFIDWAGREIFVDSQAQAPDLDEHWAKRSIELLFAQGILKNPNIDYNAEVTRYEAVKMLSLAKGLWYYDISVPQDPSFPDVSKDNEYYYYIENAVNNKLITPDRNKFNGSETISREEFAKLLVSLTGYSDIAKHSDIFKVYSEKNVSKDMIGYVAVCRALDILPVAPGEVFDASGKVTFAEAAAALYKALSFIK